jgi:hypothetical protein
MKRRCEDPDCCDAEAGSGRSWLLRSKAKWWSGCSERCSADETDEELRSVGIIVLDATEEDFRSSPFHISSGG